MVDKSKSKEILWKSRGGYAVSLSKAIYCDHLLFSALRDIGKEYGVYVDEKDDNWILWVKTDKIEDALSVAEIIFKAGMERGELGR